LSSKSLLNWGVFSGILSQYIYFVKYLVSPYKGEKLVFSLLFKEGIKGEFGF
jgi:hypothetical protein